MKKNKISPSWCNLQWRTKKWGTGGLHPLCVGKSVIFKLKIDKKLTPMFLRNLGWHPSFSKCLDPAPNCKMHYLLKKIYQYIQFRPLTGYTCTCLILDIVYVCMSYIWRMNDFHLSVYKMPFQHRRLNTFQQKFNTYVYSWNTHEHVKVISGMAARLVQNISDDYLSCSICLQRFCEPRKLNCEHTFCRKYRCEKQRYLFN